MTKPDIIVLGQLVADIVVRPVDGFPEIGAAHGVDGIELRPGGCGLNTATVLKRLGLSSVGLVGKVGQDTFGKYLCSQIEIAGLDARGVVTDSDARTSSVIVMVSSSGDRSFLYAPGGNEALCLRDIDFELISESKVLHVAGIMKLTSLKTAEVLKRAKEMGLVTSLDTDWDTSNRWLELIGPSLSYTDMLFSNIQEARSISRKETLDEIGDFFFGFGIKTLVVKMGERGSYIKTTDNMLTLPAYKVKVVDTTGAGDTFVAGFLAGYQKGWDLAGCAKLASACGALCVTGLGATAGIENLEDTLAFMEQTQWGDIRAQQYKQESKADINEKLESEKRRSRA